MTLRPIAFACVVAAATLSVLSLTGKEQGPPRTAQPYMPPRTHDGHPDLQGIWQALTTAVWDIQDHSPRLDIPAGQGIVEGNEIPYRPEALKQRQANAKNREADPETKCHMVGVPRIMYMPYPLQIVQTPKQITILSEYAHTVRSIYMDTKHPPGHIDWWMGDARGRWEGNTLVVDVIHFTDQTWFDRSGNFHSEALHVVERITPTGPDHLLYEATIEDPKTFTRPWKVSFPLYRRRENNVQLLEYECYAYVGRS